MSFDPVIAATRFGFGLSPDQPLPDSAAAMLDQLAGRDRAARDWPIPGFADAAPTLADLAEVARRRADARRAGNDARRRAADADYRRLNEQTRKTQADNFAATLTRAVAAEDGLRERLVRFWADHFTVTARQGTMTHRVAPYVEEAIRPHVTARFADLLKAAVLHPMMLLYLQQTDSVGPTSRAARGGRRGLNENLARELLELHTIGVGADYVQADVREMAELLTGLSFDIADGFHFVTARAEPGAETVLGVTYDSEASLANIRRALDDLAAHPATAAHIGHKLAVHFVADDPDPGLVDTLAGVFADSGGDLMAVTAALLDHPASWRAAQKAKPPFDFVASALRALGVAPRVLSDLSERDMARRILRPLRVMGQDWERPGGPDGWPEAAAAWITPQGMAGRITWAMTVPQDLVRDLPDPRAFVTQALGATAPAAVLFAAGAAETREVGIGVTLASAAFQRR